MFKAVSNTNPFSATTVSGLQRWYSPETANFTVESGNRITQWNDTSGNARNATATTGTTARPTLTANAIGNRNSVTFDGVTNYLDGGTHQDLVSASGATGTAAYTIAVVWSRAAFPGTANYYEQLLNLRTTFASKSIVFVLTNLFASYRESNVGVAGAAALLSSSTNLTNVGQGYTTYTSFNGVNEGTGGGYVLQQNALTSTLTTTASWTVADVNQYGRYPNAGGSGYFNGKISEILIYNRLLGQTDRQTVRTYLQRKYGT